MLVLQPIVKAVLVVICWIATEIAFQIASQLHPIILNQQECAIIALNFVIRAMGLPLVIACPAHLRSSSMEEVAFQAVLSDTILLPRMFVSFAHLYVPLALAQVAIALFATLQHFYKSSTQWECA